MQSNVAAGEHTSPAVMACNIALAQMHASDRSSCGVRTVLLNGLRCNNLSHLQADSMHTSQEISCSGWHDLFHQAQYRGG